MKQFNETMMLQTTVAVLSLIPVGAGLAGSLLGTPVFDGGPMDVRLESHFHYLSGLLLAIGLGFWSCIPHIKKRTERFRILTLIVFVGSLARLVALVMDGSPGPGMLGGLAMELVVTPLLCLWQKRISHKIF